VISIFNLKGRMNRGREVNEEECDVMRGGSSARVGEVKYKREEIEGGNGRAGRERISSTFFISRL
jgi:hypothetical protein